MSNLTNYEISIWDDVFDTSQGKFVEQKSVVIGASDLITQSRALSPHLKRSVNGTNEFDFEMYYQYIDNITGEKVDNPFVKYLANETKIKLRREENGQIKWYDFIIKDISEDSVKKLFKYKATDLHVNELSKSGYGLTLDTEIGNNIGTVEELGVRIFDGTDWEVEAEKIPQKTEESLVEIKFYSNVTFNNVVRLNESGIAPEEESIGDLTITITNDGLGGDGKSIYVFYSTLKDGKDRFQFIYSDEELWVNGDRIIQNKNCQYYIDGITYSNPVSGSAFEKYGLKFPSVFTNVSINNSDVSISHDYRAERYVFSHNVLFNNVLNRYVTEYKDNEDVLWHEYTETEYISPKLIQNLVSNTDFKSTTGWTGQYSLGVDGATKNNVSKYGTEREIGVEPDVLEALLDGTYNTTTDYTPYLKAKFKHESSILINSGPFDNRKKIENFSANEKYILMWDCVQGWKDTSFIEVTTKNFLDYFKVVVGERNYIVTDNAYESGGDDIIVFEPTEDNAVGQISVKIGEKGEGNNKKDITRTYGYLICQVREDYNLTKQQFLAKKFQLFLIPNKIGSGIWNKSTEVRIRDLQLFKYVAAPESTTGFLTPESQPTETEIITKYYYFNPNNNINKNATTEQEMIIEKRAEKKPGLLPSYREGAEKTVTLSVKQSNYFNAAQSLAETAQCWANFEVTHNEDGEILGKKVQFKNYIGQDNYAGFRYGVNLKQITRNIVSKSIVSKLIVADVVNEYANNGFCSIGRAGSNETGESFIYDFTHYIRHNQLDYDALQDVLYGPKGSNVDDPNTPKGPDVNPNWEDGNDRNIYGYYFRLGNINKRMDELSTSLSSHTMARLQAEADLQVASAGKTKSAEEHETAAIDFLKLAGYEYTNANGKSAEIKNNKELNEAFTKAATLKVAYENYVKQEAAAQALVNQYAEIEAGYNTELEKLKSWKKYLNDEFTNRYRRFIQEGTWNKQESIDDEKYYLEAKSVAYTSAQPQITYSISVISLDGVEGYEDFNFQLADKTFMEDEEYFGYNEDGTPYREEVVLTEINYYLDQPEKTTIKVQNFKNQFQDLFQRITASVQTVNYASGAWQSAADFMQSSKQDQATFLTNALNSAEIVLQNAGEQSVVTDKEGITVTDLSSPDQKLRIVGGAIMLGSIDENGQEKWSVGMTAQGINAKNITTGRLNTGEVVIMNGNQPTFRWDSYGITAFGFDTPITEGDVIIDQNYNFKKGVRFDRFGIYGYENQNSSWAPISLDEVKEKSQFALTWDGLFFRLGNGKYKAGAIEIPHSSQAIIGKVDNNIYNFMNDDGIPEYKEIFEEGEAELDKFVSIFAAGGESGNNLVIYDNGTVACRNIYLVNGIHFAADTTPSRKVYAKESLAKPVNGTKYSSFKDKDTEGDGLSWHKIRSTEDEYYAQTDDAGATWEGPYVIVKAIVDTITQYTIGVINSSPSELSGWQDDYPTQELEEGKCIYSKTWDVYDDGDVSEPRYSSSGGQGPQGPPGPSGPGAISCYVESSLGNFYNIDLAENTKIIFTAKIFQGTTEIDESGSGLVYTWYIDGEPVASESNKTWDTTLGVVKGVGIKFSATEKIKE